MKLITVIILIIVGAMLPLSLFGYLIWLYIFGVLCYNENIKGREDQYNK